MNREEDADPLDELLARPGRPASADIDDAFLRQARNAFAASGYEPLALLAANPGLSLTELAQRLASRSNLHMVAIGILMVVYEEAVKQDKVREVAKDLLIRQIKKKFPEGWSSQGTVHPLAKIGGWDSDIKRYVDPRTGEYARQVIQHLTIDQLPPEGWQPEIQNDPIIDELFDRYWPLESDRADQPSECRQQV